MPRENPIIANFTGGLITPRLDRRVDLAWYPNSTRIQENFLSLPHGPAVYRQGTIFVSETSDSSFFHRLIPFEFSTVQRYMLSFGNGTVQIFRDKGFAPVLATDAAIANGDFTSDIAGWSDASAGTGAIGHDAANGRLNLIGAGSGNEARADQPVTHTKTFQEHILKFRVLSIAGDSVTLRIGTTAGGEEILASRVFEVGYHAVAFTPGASPFHLRFENAAAKTIQLDDVAILNSGGSASVPPELGSPYASADLIAIKYAQSFDVLRLARAGTTHPPYKLVRVGDTSWSLVEILFEDGPYLPENTDDSKTLQPSAASGLGITITASGHEPWAASDVGRLVRIKNGAKWGYAVITGFTSPTVVTADVKQAFAGATANAAWRLGEFSATTGYPAAVVFHESRLVWGGSPQRPDGADLSRIDDFPRYSPDTDFDDQVADDDAIQVRLAANKVNAIRWLASTTKVILAGTTGVEARIGVIDTEDTLKPSKAPFKPLTQHGAADLLPLQIGNVVLFVQRQLQKVRELAFSLEADNFVAPDLTIRAEQITLGGIVDWAYQQEPWSIVWAVRADGRLLGFTYVRDQQVTAWHEHPVGGTDAKVESVAVIPGAGAGGDGEDELWMIVARTVNGATRRHIEVLSPRFDDNKPDEDAFFVDSGLTYSGPAITTLTGLDHLEGETVQINSEGAVHPERVVTGGQVTLTKATTKAHVGLGYTGRLKPVRMEAGATIGTSQGQRKRISKVAVAMFRTGGVQIGRDGGRLHRIPFRKPSDPMGKAVPLFTGERVVNFSGKWGSDPDLIVIQDKPLPCTLVGLIPNPKTNEKR